MMDLRALTSNEFLMWFERTFADFIVVRVAPRVHAGLRFEIVERFCWNCQNSDGDQLGCVRGSVEIILSS